MKLFLLLILALSATADVDINLIGNFQFITFDGLIYTFNGNGDYTFFEVPDVHLTARIKMTRVLDDKGTSLGSKIKSLTVFTLAKDTMMLETENGSLAIYVNGDLFKQKDTIMDYKLNGLDLKYNDDKNVTIDYRNGIKIAVFYDAVIDKLSIRPHLIRSVYTGKARGLLGVNDGNKSNDFTLPNGKMLNISPRNVAEVYYKFGEQWKV